MSHLSVAKFGGTSVANYSAMQACAKIVIADPNTRVVVLSASAGVTNLLVALANGVEAEERAKLIGEVRQIQENILNELKDDSRIRPIIEKYLENITALSEAASLATSLALTDELISHGEMMSTQIFIEVLRELQTSATWVDVRTLVATNDNFGKAAPDDAQTQANCDNLLKEKFSDKDFKSDIKCNINLSDMTYSIDSLEVGVRENGIRLVDKIRINVNDESEEAVSNNEKIDNEEEIKNYLSELFKIPIEKIKLYSMGG